MIGTSDQSCWLAESCKNPSLEGLWMYGVTVYLDRSYGSDSAHVRVSGGRLLSTIKSFRSRRLVTRFKCGCHGFT